MARFEVRPGFPEDQRARVAELYWEAFSDKIGGILGPKRKGLRFFCNILDPAFAISVLSDAGEVLGVAGFKTRDGALADGDLKDLQAVYGWFGGLWRGLFLTVLIRKVGPELLQMDGIFVGGAARGLGIGSVLLDAISEKARSLGLEGVRLDVIDSNTRAKKLYERKGFVAVSQDDLGPLRWVFGYRRSTRMELRY